MSTYWATNWPIWISAFCVLAVYSYLFKDNALYRVMMQVFIGVNLGYQAIIQWRDVLYPQWWLPMIDGFHALAGGPGSLWGALWAIVGVIGILFYLQLSRKYASLSKIAIGITIGIGAGLTFKSQFGQNLPQVLDTFKPLGPPIVRPQPRTVIQLPGSAFPSTVDDSLAIFVEGTKVSANEVLGGTNLWTVNLPLPPTGPGEMASESVHFPTAGGEIRLSRSSGQIIRGTIFDINRLKSQQKIDQMSSNIKAQTNGTPLKQIGSLNGRIFALFSKRLYMFDSEDGKMLANINLPVTPNSTPCVAVYRQPQFANGVILVPAGNELQAYAFRDKVAEGVASGDLLWSAKYPERIVGVDSFDGVALVTGARASAIWDIPAPQAKLGIKDYFDNWVAVVTVVCVMSYFFFSFKKRGPAVVAASNVGRYLLMIGFGAFFGNTVMTRMSFLLDRLMFLIDDWLRPFFHQFFR
jgi:hypothetical protein